MDGKKIVLTDDTLTNIKLMAPELNRDQQLQVFGMLVGIAITTGKDIDFKEQQKTV